MGFEVVGLPHYVIWHVYEPSADDLLHIEQMEREKEMMVLDVEDVELSRLRWEKDKKAMDAAIEKMRMAEKADKARKQTVAVGGEEGPVAHVGEEGVSDQGNGLTDTEAGRLIQRQNVERRV
jgi:mannan polymerase II complex ANP1 subunit